MFFVYILKSLNFPKFYTGQTDDLALRLIRHNQGYSIYSRRYAPWRVVYHESVKSKKEAVERERYLKSAAGRRWLKKQINVRV